MSSEQLPLTTAEGIKGLWGKRVEMGYLQRENAISLLSSSCKASIKWGMEEEAFWQAAFAARLAKTFLVDGEDFFVAGWWMEGGEA